MFEGLAGQSGAGLLQQSLCGPKLGVGSSLGFMVPARAADFSAEFTESGFDLFHCPDPMSLVIVLGLSERRVSIVQQGRGVDLGLDMGNQAKNQQEDGEQG